MSKPEFEDIDGLMFNYIVQHKQRLTNMMAPLKVELNVVSKDRVLDRVRWILVCDMSVRLSVGADKVLEFLDSVNLEEFLR
jgi:hypothetical protein